MDCSPPGSSVHGDSPVQNTEVSCHALLQGIFPTQGLNPGLPHCRQILHCLSHKFNTSLFFCSYCCSCGHWELFHLAPVSLWHPPVIVAWVVVFLFLCTYLLSDTTRCSRLILHVSAPVWESAICPRNLSSFTRRLALKTKIWPWVCLLLYSYKWMSLVLGPLSWQSKEICL